jgi:hypothetical protein
MTLFPRKGQQHRPAADIAATEDANRLADAAPGVVDAAAESEWYHEHGSEVDRAAYTLCLLRRARAGQLQSPVAGDEAVRAALAQADQAAVVWLASRAISYMDEMGFPDTVELWFES